MTYEHKNQKELKPMANQTETDNTMVIRKKKKTYHIFHDCYFPVFYIHCNLSYEEDQS
jgi:hypothetical protein